MNTAFIGFGFALLAMVGWGFGDYYIQRVSRSLGIWKCIFFISLIGSIGLLPLVWKKIHLVAQGHNVLFFLLGGCVMMFATLFDYRALKEGKLSIIEPIVSTELPLAVIFAVVLWHESLSALGWVLIIAIFVGTTLAVTQHNTHLQYHKRILEKGVLFALAAAIGMALLDLVMGISSQETAPLLTVWMVWIFGGVVSFARLAADRKMGQLVSDFRRHTKLILGVGVLDTLGWAGFCLATSYIPISISTAIAESFVIITVLLGLFVNHEKIKWHQKAGLMVVVASVIMLALLAG